MSRLRGVPRDEAEARVLRMYDMLFGDRDPVAEPGTATGTPGDWWTAFANVPDIFDHAVRGFGLYRSGRRVLDPVLRELELANGVQAAIEFLEPHTAFFTWAGNYGNHDCLLPVSERFSFVPTRQPLLLDIWEGSEVAGSRFTTVAGWRAKPSWSR